MLLEVKNLTVQFKDNESVVKALNDVNLTICQGETLGLVGETGAGKTTLAKGIMRLIQCPPGEIKTGNIFFNGKDLLKLPVEEMRRVRGKEISMIFQDPMTSLNPVMTVGDQIAEVILTHHHKLLENEVKKRTCEMLELVGITPDRYREYPHQFSGGMRQRIVIAIALACNPKLLIADEPTTALDVTIQAQVLEMINDLKKKFDTSVLLITHDLGVVAQNCDRVAILYAGEIIEHGSVADVFHNHLHPYTEGLLGSIPSLVEDVARLKPIEGLMPDPTNLSVGCKFSPRCKKAMEICYLENPKLMEQCQGHSVRCWLYAEK